MLFKNLRITDALSIIKRCRVITARTVYSLIIYYALAVFSALIDGVSLVLLIDLITGKAGADSNIYIMEILSDWLRALSFAPDFDNLFFLLTGFFLVKVVLIFAYTALDGYFEASLRRTLQEHGFASVLRGDWEVLRNIRVGERVGAITEEASNVAKYFMSAVRSIYSLLAVIVLSVLALMVSLEVSVLFIAIGIPVLLVLKYLFNLQAKIAEKLVNERQGFYAGVTERLSGLFQIKVEGNSRHHIGQGLKNQEKLTSLEVSWWNLRAYIYAFNVLLPVTVLISSYFWALFTGVALKEIISLVAGVGILGARALAQVNQLSANIGNITGFAGSIPPVLGLLSIPEEPFKKPMPEKLQCVEVNNVSYLYNKKSGVSGMTLRSKIERPLIMMGESGSGKTTMANLIAGLYRPASGRIDYIGLSGTSYNSLEYRPSIGYVAQDIHLFHGTVRENLVASSECECDDDTLWKCLRLSGADEFVKNLGGLEAVISEAGRSLSGGQRRRIGIARVLTGSPDILILDEVTTGLDDTRKKELVETVKDLSRSLVVVIITHDTDMYAVGLQIGEIVTLKS